MSPEVVGAPGAGGAEDVLRQAEDGVCAGEGWVMAPCRLCRS